MKNNLKVYIADDHNVVRNGMMRLLNTFTRVKELKDAENGKALIDLIKKDVPDAVILDIEMPVMNGYDTAQYILDHYKDVKILALTMHAEVAVIDRLMDIGVHGFLNKSSQAAEVEKALYAVIDKDFYRNEIVTAALNKTVQKKGPDSFGSKLSPRELEILLLICREHTPQEISARLKISEKTFFNHRTNIIAKTGSRNNVGLLKYAFIHGIYELEKQE